MQIIVFKLNDSHFAIPTDNVDEITKYASPTSIPNAPFGVEGLVNLRGSVVAQVSLNKLLNMDVEGEYRNVIVINNDTHKVGLLINEVLKVMNVDEGSVQSIGTNKESGVKGIIEIENIIVSMLDLESLLGDKFESIA